MGSNFLLKEEHLRKINADLEKKTSELMKDYESLLRVQNHTTGSSTQKSTVRESASERVRRPSAAGGPPSYSARRTQSAVQHGHQLPHAAGNLLANRNGDNISLHTDVGKGPGDPLEAGKGLGTEALISFLRASVRVLQEEVRSLQSDLKTKVEECREQQSHLKRVEEERAKWMQLATSSKERVKKLEHQCSVAATKQQQKETENVALRKEVESLTKELKICTQAASSGDVRLNRCLEDTDKLKACVKQLKQEKKDLQDESRTKNNELLFLVKRLERQKMELISGFKKQMQLIDNLTRQKVHLEAGRVVQFAEKEFLKLLDSASENEDKLSKNLCK